MALLTWTPDLDTGIETIDSQRKQIVDYINQLHEVQQTGNRDETLKVMDGLVNYTATHFADGEAILEKAAYSPTEAHTGVHVRFVDKVSKLYAEHGAGMDTAEDLLNLLEGWLFTHIRLNDMAYVESLKAAGIKEGCSSPQIVASKAFAARFISPRLSSRSHCVPPICRHSTAERSAESNSARISPTT